MCESGGLVLLFLLAVGGGAELIVHVCLDLNKTVNVFMALAKFSRF